MSYSIRDRLVNGTSSRTWYGTALLLLVVAPFVLPPFQVSLLTEVLVFAIFATAFNLLYGYTGLLSFGHAMFLAVSGYTVAKVVQVVAPALHFAEVFGGASVLVTFVLAVILGVLAATLLAVFVGYLSVQLEEIYFALITLSFSMAIYFIALQNIIVYTNGSDGLTFLLGDVTLFGFEFTLMNIRYPLEYYFIVLLFFVGSLYALWRVVHSPFGMVCRAIRENADRAEAMGIDVTRHSWYTFIVSGTFSGLAGALLIPLLTNVNPDHAHWTTSAEPVIMTVIGGPYSFLGPVAGAFTYRYLRWGISRVQFLEAHWQLFMGLLILVVVLFFNEGVAGWFARARRWVVEGTGERSAPEPEDAD